MVIPIRANHYHHHHIVQKKSSSPLTSRPYLARIERPLPYCAADNSTSGQSGAPPALASPLSRDAPSACTAPLKHPSLRIPSHFQQQQRCPVTSAGSTDPL